jgi:NADPH-dependent 2,4-dienoyl-CoA reductase/sulfur reductase-like enzyme
MSPVRPTVHVVGRRLDRLSEAFLPVVFDGDAFFANATVDRLAEAWNLNGPPSRSRYDLAIIGASTSRGVEELLGRDVYYGAGRSEAAQCSDEDVLVVGAGNSAGQAALNLARAGARVWLCTQQVC